MKNLVPILNDGHGQIINGVYQTPGKRSPNWEKGILYEGMFNNWVCNRLMEKLDRRSIPYYHVNPEHTDTPLEEVVSRANKIYKNHPNTYLLSIHANAGGGEGNEIWTSKGQTKSDPIAQEFALALKTKLPEIFRADNSDGDLDKESNFYVLKFTNGPALLIECGFMDNIKDYNRLWDEARLDKLVTILADVIEKLYKGN